MGVEHDDRLDQRELSQLWTLENDGRADRRAKLDGERFLSLFLDVLGGRSYIFEHGTDAANEEVDVGDAELYRYETARQAQIAYGEMLREARQEGRLVDTDSMEDIGDPAVDGPTTTDTGADNERNT